MIRMDSLVVVTRFEMNAVNIAAIIKTWYNHNQNTALKNVTKITYNEDYINDIR